MFSNSDQVGALPLAATAAGVQLVSLFSTRTPSLRSNEQTRNGHEVFAEEHKKSPDVGSSNFSPDSWGDRRQRPARLKRCAQFLNRGIGQGLAFWGCRLARRNQCADKDNNGSSS